MKVKANGVTFNFDISGRDNAPWLIFSNSLATSEHQDERPLGRRNLEGRFVLYLE